MALANRMATPAAALAGSDRRHFVKLALDGAPDGDESQRANDGAGKRERHAAFQDEGDDRRAARADGDANRHLFAALRNSSAMVP